MAVTLSADELAAAVNGGDQWDAAEKTRMLALATAVYVAEGLKHETPDALSNEYAIRVAAFLAQSARLHRAVGSRRSKSCSRSCAGFGGAGAPGSISEIRGVRCFKRSRECGGRRGALVSNLALRALTKKIFSMRSYQRPRASGIRRWPGRSGRSRLRRGCGLAASQALASLPRILGRPRLQRKSGRVSAASSRAGASASSLSTLTARAKSRSGSRDSGTCIQRAVRARGKASAVGFIA